MYSDELNVLSELKRKGSTPYLQRKYTSLVFFKRRKLETFLEGKLHSETLVTIKRSVLLSPAFLMRVILWNSQHPETQRHNASFLTKVSNFITCTIKIPRKSTNKNTIGQSMPMPNVECTVCWFIVECRPTVCLTLILQSGVNLTPAPFKSIYIQNCLSLDAVLLKLLLRPIILPIAK